MLCSISSPFGMGEANRNTLSGQVGQSSQIICVSFFFGSTPLPLLAPPTDSSGSLQHALWLFSAPLWHHQPLVSFRQWLQGFYQHCYMFMIMYHLSKVRGGVCACVHACACACVCVRFSIFLPSISQSLKEMDVCSRCCWAGNHFEILWFI